MVRIPGAITGRACLLALLAAATAFGACTSGSGSAFIRQVERPVEPFRMEPDELCLAFEHGAPPPAVDRGSEAEPAFPGLLRGSGPQDGVRYVFHTHGMGLTNKCKFANGLFRHLRERGYRLDPAEPSTDWTPARTRAHAIRGEGLDCRDELANAPPCLFRSFGEYRIDNLVGPGGARVRVWSYYWHASLWAVQEPYLRADMALDPGWISGPVKTNTIDGGLADAAAYLGEMGPVLREGMGGTVCRMLRDLAEATPEPSGHGLRGCLSAAEEQAAPPASLNFISHSLGSRMLFDVLGDEYGDDNTPDLPATQDGRAPDPARELVRTRETTFFMAANQLPLLGPGRVRREVDPAERLRTDPCDDLPAFLRDRCGPAAEGLFGRAPSAPLHVVGFVDPGDLLGFRVDGGVLPEAYGDRIRFTVVEHRNAPQILGAGTWPLDAHDRELEKDSASALILCGGVAPGEGDRRPVRARACGGRP